MFIWPSRPHYKQIIFFFKENHPNSSPVWVFFQENTLLGVFGILTISVIAFLAVATRRTGGFLYSSFYSFIYEKCIVFIVCKRVPGPLTTASTAVSLSKSSTKLPIGRAMLDSGVSLTIRWLRMLLRIALIKTQDVRTGEWLVGPVISSKTKIIKAPALLALL